GTRKVVDEKTGQVIEVSPLADGDTMAKPAKARGDEGTGFAPTQPLLVALAGDLRERVDAPALEEELLALRRALYVDLGVPFPAIALRFDDALPQEAYVIL